MPDSGGDILKKIFLGIFGLLKLAIGIGMLKIGILFSLFLIFLKYFTLDLLINMSNTLLLRVFIFKF